MKSFFPVIAILLFFRSLFGQAPVIKIEEDYTKPLSYMWEVGDKYQERYLENGMYVGKAGDLPASLSFAYEMTNQQRNIRRTGDMEFTIVKIKGKPEDFIVVCTDPVGNSDVPYLKFAYNEKGQWKLGGHKLETVYLSGNNIEVQPGSNVIRIEYRQGKMRYFMNGTPVTDFDLKEKNEISWRDIKVEAMNTKTVIALDKITLYAYNVLLPFSNDSKGAGSSAIEKTPRYRTVEANYGKKRFITFREDPYAKEWGLMNSNGLVILEPVYQSINVDMMNKYGIASVKSNNNYSIIDSTGRELAAGLSDVMNFFEDLAAVQQGGKWGYLNTRAQMVIPPQFEAFTHFSHGTAIVSKRAGNDYYYGVIDKTGKTVIDFKYKQIDGFFEGLGIVKEANDKWGIIENSGKVIVAATYDSLSTGMLPYFLASIGGKFGLIDKAGKMIVPVKYDEVSQISGAGNLFRVKTGNKVQLLDSRTALAVGSSYDNISDFNSGLAVVELNGKKGFINSAGKVIIPIIYEDARGFFDSGDTDVTRVKLNGKVIIIDKTGKKVSDTTLKSVFNN